MSAWDDYWGSGFLSSFPDDPKEIYKNSSALYWQPKLEALELESASVLELGAGNGELTQQVYPLLQHCEPLTYLATDAAAISTEAYQNRGLVDVEVQSGVYAEELPYADQSYDLILSQFGVEYANWRLVLPQLKQKLKAGGRFVALCHHQDSILIQQQKAFLLLPETKQLLDILEAICSPSKRDKGKRKLQAFQQSLSIEKERGLVESGLINEFNHVAKLSAHTPANKLLERVADMRKRFISYFERIQEMNDAALNSETIEQLKQQSDALGLTWSEPLQVKLEGHTFALGIEMINHT